MLKTVIRFFILFMLFTKVYANEINLNELLKVAKDQNKHIMLFHHIPKCSYCKKMIDENFKDPKILDIIKKNFIYVDIYTADKDKVIFKEFSGTHKKFSQYIGAVAYPATIFINMDGKVVHRAIGYRNIDEYFAEITYISTNSYKIMDLESYIEKLEFEKE
jgi:thioredoxin-related protein